LWLAGPSFNTRPAAGEDCSIVTGGEWCVLPFVLIFMLLLINKKELMGEYVNTHLFNAVAWLTTAVMIGLTVAMVLDLERQRLAR
jgi:hypothetical protein